MKKIAAAALAFALIGGAVTAGNMSVFSSIMTAKAETVEGEDLDHLDNYDPAIFDEKTGVLHLKGKVRNSNDGSRIILPKNIQKYNILHIVADEGTVLPQDCSYLFSSIPYVCSIDLKNADTSNVTDMSYMFYIEDTGEVMLCDIDLSSFDTSNVTTMKGMFAYRDCQELDLSSFDTSNVTDMSDMFAGCYCLKELEFGDINTSNVTDMSGMFRNTMYPDYSPDTCFLTSVDFSAFDTSSVTDMSCMFLYSRFDKLDLSGFDTSNVRDMDRMFSECYCLETIIVGPNWSTESSEGESMFYGCISLTGGAGTVYDNNHIGIEYAHVDGGKKDPGYLTAVENNTSNTIVIYIPEETMDAINYLYDCIDNPVVKDVISAAKDIISKYISIKIF